MRRHTAPGDAIVTADVFPKMISLLAAMGIHTLGEVREAAQKTYPERTHGEGIYAPGQSCPR